MITPPVTETGEQRQTETAKGDSAPAVVSGQQDLLETIDPKRVKLGAHTPEPLPVTE